MGNRYYSWTIFAEVLLPALLDSSSDSTTPYERTPSPPPRMDDDSEEFERQCHERVRTQSVLLQPLQPNASFAQATSETHNVAGSFEQPTSRRDMQVLGGPRADSPYVRDSMRRGPLPEIGQQHHDAVIGAFAKSRPQMQGFRTTVPAPAPTTRDIDDLYKGLRARREALSEHDNFKWKYWRTSEHPGIRACLFAEIQRDFKALPTLEHSKENGRRYEQLIKSRERRSLPPNSITAGIDKHYRQQTRHSGGEDGILLKGLAAYQEYGYDQSDLDNRSNMQKVDQKSSRQQKRPLSLEPDEVDPRPMKLISQVKHDADNPSYSTPITDHATQQQNNIPRLLRLEPLQPPRFSMSSSSRSLNTTGRSHEASVTKGSPPSSLSSGRSGN
ncbi:hypothetical protein BDV96DRAFT_626789, partial [Lophiotrema nucula]